MIHRKQIKEGVVLCAEPGSSLFIDGVEFSNWVLVDEKPVFGQDMFKHVCSADILKINIEAKGEGEHETKDCSTTNHRTD